MKQRLLHIVLIILCTSAHFARGESPPWQIEWGPGQSFVLIEQGVHFGNRQAQEGDYIAAYVIKDDEEIFIGEHRIQNTGGSIEVMLSVHFGNDSSMASIGDLIFWKGWDAESKCLIELRPQYGGDVYIDDSITQSIPNLKPIQNTWGAQIQNWELCEDELPWTPSSTNEYSFEDEGWFPGPGIIFNPDGKLTQGTILDTTTYLIRSFGYCNVRDTAYLTVNSIPDPQIIVDSFSCDGEVMVDWDYNGPFTWLSQTGSHNIAVPNHSTILYSAVNGSCSKVGQVEIEAHEITSADISLDIIPATCDEGSKYFIDITNLPFSDSLILSVDGEITDPEMINLLDPGVYELSLEDLSACLDPFSVNVDLNPLPAPDISDLQFKQTNVICEDLGSIVFDSVQWAEKEVTKIVANGIEFNTPNLSELQSGYYSIYGVNEYGCESPISLVVKINETSCSELAIYPDNSQSPDAPTFVDVPFEGNIVVVDRDGNIISAFVGPGIWDAKDENGNTVPSGIYFIQSDSDEFKSVTVIR